MRKDGETAVAPHPFTHCLRSDAPRRGCCYRYMILTGSVGSASEVEQPDDQDDGMVSTDDSEAALKGLCQWVTEAHDSCGLGLAQLQEAGSVWPADVTEVV